MKRVIKDILTVLVFVLLMGGVGGYAVKVVTADQPVRVPQPAVIMEVLDPTLLQFAPAWQREIGRRFPNAVGILCHGGDLEQGRWVVRSDLSRHLETARDVAERYQKLYPGRTIVLLACNPGHLKLNLPGVYHFHSSVWCVPDRAVTGSPVDSLTRKLHDYGFDFLTPDAPKVNRSDIDPDVEGNIFEATDE